MVLSRQNVRLAARSFMRHPGFTIVAVLSLALAIALNTTMYSVLDAMIAPAVDMRDPGQVYALTVWGATKHRPDDATMAALLRSGLHDFEAVSYARSDGWGIAAEYGQQYALVRGSVVAPNYFALLGTRMLAGRSFGDADVSAATPTVVISDRLAHTLFVDGASGVGRVIQLDGAPYAVVGELETTAHTGDDYWRLPPRDVNLAALPITIMRLKRGVPMSRVDAQLQVLAARLAVLARDDPKNVQIQLTSEGASQFQYKAFHFALIGAVVAVLLIACANLANMQLARGIARGRELAVRAALGASRLDIIGQLLLESVILAAAGLLLGIVSTLWATEFLRWRIPSQVQSFVVAPHTSWRVFAFAIVVCAVCVLIVGLLPAIRISRVDPNELLKSGAGTGAHSKYRRQYGTMVAAQIALSLALLSATALILHQAILIYDVKPTLDLKPLASATLFGRWQHDTTVALAAELNAAAAAVRAEPDVVDAAASMARMVSHHAITVASANGVTEQVSAPDYSYLAVSAGYFRTYGQRVTAGRDFLDGVPAAPEVIVDKTTARKLWPGASPVGALIKLGADTTNVPWLRVVGVVPDAEDRMRNVGSVAPTDLASRLGRIYYLPGARDSAAIHVTSATFMGAYSVIARAKTDAAHLPITLRRVLVARNPGSVVYAVTMEQQIGLVAARQSQSFIAGMFVLFTALALGLAALGVYGVIAHSVAERRRELGVRVALGATSGHILNVVLRDGNVFALAGIAVGLWIVKHNVWWLRSFSLEDDAYNAPLFAAMAAVLFAVVLTAALIPALRATRIDPVESLRNE